MDHTLMSFLNRNPRKNMAILGFFNNYPVLEYMIEKDSIMILGKSDHIWAHISSESPAEFSILLENNHMKTQYYHSVEDWMIPLILEYGDEAWMLTTNRYILDPHVPVDPPGLRTDHIDIGHTPYIYENSEYRDFLSAAYIEERKTK